MIHSGRLRPQSRDHWLLVMAPEVDDHGIEGVVRVVVIGGGISGLSAAWFLRQSLGPAADIVVLEKKDVVGGHLRVSDVAGLPVDEGAESVLARRPEAVDLIHDVGLGDAIVHPAMLSAAQLWSRDRLTPIPASTVMGVPTDRSMLSDVLTSAEATQVVDRDLSGGLPLDEDVAIGALVEERMGRAVVDRLVDPLLGGVYAGHADNLSVDATIPALGAALRASTSLAEAAAVAGRSRGDSPDGPVFAGIDGGIGRIPGAVAAASKAAIRTGVTVREVHQTPTGWRIVTGAVPAPTVLEADAVVIAVSSTPAARLLRDVDASAAAALTEIESASMAIVTIAVPVDAFPEPLETSGFLVPAVDGHTIKAVTYSSVKWPWLGERAGDLVVLRASVGRHRQVADLQKDDSELVDLVMRDLNAACGLTGTPVDSRVTRWGGALPQYAVGHLERVRRVRNAVGRHPGLSICGSIFDGVGIPACIQSAHTAVDQVVASMGSVHERR